VQVQEEEPEPSRTVPLVERIRRIVGPVLDVVALVAAHQQHEGLAVVAKALAVLGQSSVAIYAFRARR
jgi:hypothetical protein